jgi:hypothetical protein
MRRATSNLVDVQNRVKETVLTQVFVAVIATASLTLAAASPVRAESAAAAGPPPSSVGFFPLSQLKRGMTGTAWTVFEGTKPEPMEVEILGVLRNSRGPGRDLILARLHGTKPEYTGVVAGMSGSPVYVEGKLLGALSYRIGQFSKEPIAGITPIEQMLEVRDLPEAGPEGGPANRLLPSGPAGQRADTGKDQNFTAIETPLLMSGFQPEAIQVWKDRMAGSGLDSVMAGGNAAGGGGDTDFGPMVPGSAVSLELVRGDLEIAATCTVTYVDPKQLLACGHPVLQSGRVSLPMTSTEVVATLPSPLNAFKIVNTGRVIGAFTEDRDAAIRGELGATARMIPLSISLPGNGSEAKSVERHLEVLDLPSTTPSAVLVSLYQVLLQSNESSAETTYHVTGEIAVHGQAPVPVDSWGVPGEQMAAQLSAALGVAQSFNGLYANASREAPMEAVRLKVETIPRDMRTQLESARLVSSSIVHAGDRVEVEATVRPWEQPARNVRLGFTLPAHLQPGTLRLLVGSGAALDRTLDAARPPGSPLTESGAAARLRQMHAANQVYVSLLLPETEASVEGRTLESLPLSMANTLESERSGVEVGLHGESVMVAARASAGGVLTGQQILNLRVEAGGGLH